MVHLLYEKSVLYGCIWRLSMLYKSMKKSISLVVLKITWLVSLWYFAYILIVVCTILNIRRDDYYRKSLSNCFVHKNWDIHNIIYGKTFYLEWVLKRAYRSILYLCRCCTQSDKWYIWLGSKYTCLFYKNENKNE